MKEQLISFETAKLAKEKGFDFKCDTWATFNEYRKITEYNPISLGYPCPTQSLLQRWLREKHNIFLYVENSNGIWNWIVETSIKYIEGKFYREKIDNGWNPTFEEQLEKGLLEALKLIK